MRIRIPKLLILLVMCIIIIYPAKAEEIPIGVLVDLSGPLSIYGNDIKNTLEIAKEEFERGVIPITVKRRSEGFVWLERYDLF